MRKTKKEMELTKERIIDAAIDCFYEKGYENTSLDDIAQRAGFTRGAIYWHYDNKQQLFSEVLKVVLKHGDIMHLAANAPEGAPLDERMAYVMWTMMEEEKYESFIFKAITYMIDRPEFEAEFETLKTMKRRLYTSFMVEVSIHLHEKNNTEADPEVYAKGLYFLLEGLFLTRNVTIGPLPDREMIRKLVRSVLCAIL